jgi:hypothetical protein
MDKSNEPTPTETVVDPRTMPAQILAELEAMRRDPFRRELRDLLEVPPSRDALQRFADKTPDRRAQAIAIMGRLSGYSEDIKVTANLHFVIPNMSDMELVGELRRMNQRVAELERKQGVSRRALPVTSGGQPDGAEEA